jgi:hypothetical protein
MDNPLSAIFNNPSHPVLAEPNIPQAIMNGGEIPDDQVSSGTNVPIMDVGGETQPENREISPIGSRPSSYHPTHDEDVSLEDDDILRMQIELGDVQERNLRRKIESKRRRLANTTARSANSGFNLSRDLSLEIDRDMASRLPEALAKIKVLENDNALWIARINSVREETLVHVKQQLHAEVESYKASLNSHMESEMVANAKSIEAKAEQQHAQIIATRNAEENARIEAVAERLKHELQEANGQFQQGLSNEAITMKTQLDSENQNLRTHLAEKHVELERKSHQVSRLLLDEQHMKDYIFKIKNEYDEAKATMDKRASTRIDADAVQLKAQLEKVQEDSQRDLSNLKAQYNALEVKYCKLRDTLKTEHDQESEKAVDESLKIQERRHNEAMSDVLHKVHMLHEQVNDSNETKEKVCKENGRLQEEVRDLKKENDEMKLSQVKWKAAIEELRGEIRSTHDKHKAQVAELSGEIQHLKSTREASSKTEKPSASSSSSQPSSKDKDLTFDPFTSEASNKRTEKSKTKKPDPPPPPVYEENEEDTWDYGDGQEENGEEEDPEYDEYYEEPEDDNKKRPRGKESNDINATLKRLAQLMSKKSKPSTEVKGKEADSIKIPMLPTAAQFKSWKNAVRSAVSSASRLPAQAFEWIMKVEATDVTYNDLSQCPKTFETLDAKLSAALMLICKGELGRKITLRTEEEAKAMKLIRGRQILWMVYEEYRINEEAGSLNDITDLMKVKMGRDQSKVDQLARFLLNWETVLAGIKDPPPDHQLQVMLYDQIRHVPSISSDIAMYDRAEPGDVERSYQFLIKSIQRVLQRTKRERNRKDIEKSLDHMSNGSINALKGTKGKPPKPKGGRKGKGVGEYDTGKSKPHNNCHEWMAYQTCKRGKGCLYDHPTINGWKFKGGGKGGKAKSGKGKEGKNKGKPGKGIQDDNKPIAVCRYFAAGNCKNGANCTSPHEGTVASMRDSAAKAKAKAKAKAAAAAKANESGNV